MTHFRPISIDDLTEADLLLLDKACRWFYYGEDVKTLLRRVRDGVIQLWRIENSSAEGLIGTALQCEGKELWIELLVGKGLYDEARELQKGLRAMAKRAGAVRLSGAACRPGLVKLYRDVLGATPVATLFSDEVV